MNGRDMAAMHFVKTRHGQLLGTAYQVPGLVVYRHDGFGLAAGGGGLGCGFAHTRIVGQGHGSASVLAHLVPERVIAWQLRANSDFVFHGGHTLDATRDGLGGRAFAGVLGKA